MTAMKTRDVHACLCSHCYGEDLLALLGADRSPAKGDYAASRQPKDVLQLCARTGSGEKVFSSVGISLSAGHGKAAALQQAIRCPCAPYGISSRLQVGSCRVPAFASLSGFAFLSSGVMQVINR